mgnify:CR=1 FL=1
MVVALEQSWPKRGITPITIARMMLTPARMSNAASMPSVHIVGIEITFRMISKERGSYELRSFVCRKESVKIVQYGD